MINAFEGGSNRSSTTRICQNVRHVVGIMALTKGHFGKKSELQGLTSERRNEGLKI